MHARNTKGFLKKSRFQGDFMNPLQKKFYQQCSPEPLKSEEIGPLYQDLDEFRGSDDFVERIKQEILLDDTPICRIVSGHRGCGKSTELVRLKRELEKEGVYATIISSEKGIDRNDVDFPEILLTILAELGRELEEELGIELKTGYFKTRYKELKKFLGSDVAVKEIKLSKLGTGINLSIKSSPDARKAVRDVLNPDTSSLLNEANNLIREARKQILALENGYTELVILVDDLDKIGGRIIDGSPLYENLFLRREAQLTGFDVNIIYTVPCELVYTSGSRLSPLYGQPLLSPMVKIRTRPPESTIHQDGVNALRELVIKRAQSAGCQEKDINDIIKPEALEFLVDKSGGQTRELMSFIRVACTYGFPIGLDEAKNAVRKSTHTFERQMTTEKLDILKTVQKEGKLNITEDNKKLVAELLGDRSLLHYVNDEQWYAVNPLIDLNG